MQSMLLSVMGLTLAMSSLAVAQAGDICDEALEQPQHPPVAVAFPADSADLQPRERDRLKRLVPQFLGSHNLKLCIIAQADRQRMTITIVVWRNSALRQWPRLSLRKACRTVSFSSM